MLDVVESRYNPKERQMIKIKNWASCIPEELRKTDFMPIAAFSAIQTLPKRISPFLRGITGPGCLGYPETRKRPAGGAGGDGDDSSDGEGGKSEQADKPPPVRSHKKRKPVLDSGGGGPAGGLGLSGATPGGSGSATPSVLAGAGSQAGYGSQRPSPALSRRQSAAPGSMPAPAMPSYGSAGGGAAGSGGRPYPAQPVASGSRPAPPQQGGPPRKSLDRSVVGNSGGALWVSKTASQAVVPPATGASAPSFSRANLKT